MEFQELRRSSSFDLLRFGRRKSARHSASPPKYNLKIEVTPLEAPVFYLTKTPHVDFHIIWQAKKHFRTSVKPRLNIAVDFFSDLTRASKVDDFDLGAFWIHQKDVFWFQIAVND